MTSIGDLAQSFMMRHRNAQLKQQIQALTQELSTGQVADKKKVLAGNFSHLAGIERDLSVLDGFKIATTEATHYSGTMQKSLGRIQSLTQDLSSKLIIAGTAQTVASRESLKTETQNALETLVSTLNADVAGRSIFSGTATNKTALTSTEDLLTEMKSALSSVIDPAQFLSDAENWFASPIGFDTIIYNGTDDALGPFMLSKSDQLSLDVRATDPTLKNTIMLTALSALAADPTFGFTEKQQTEIYTSIGQKMLAAQDGITSLRAKVGAAEAKIEGVTARNSAEKTSLDFARKALLEADPFDTATKLEEAQFQLQSMYSVTVRMSKLSLVNFL